MTNRRSWTLPVCVSLVTWTTLSLASPGPLQSGGPIGTNYCGPQIPNSTGVPGTISAFGSSLIAANDVTLAASNLPNDFGYFLSSMTQGYFDPGTSCMIFLCLGGAIGRHRLPGQVQMGPTFSITLDLGAIPTPTGFVAVQPGETWRFQVWYRAGPGCTLFTDAISITFQ